MHAEHEVGGNTAGDAALQTACAHAAVGLEALAREIGASGLKEVKHLKPLLRGALQVQLGDSVLGVEKAFELEGWDGGGKLGGVDLIVRGAEPDSLRYLIELKWCQGKHELGWTLWDIFKMVAATRLPGVEGCYVVTGAPDSYWESPLNCAPLFADGEWPSLALFESFHLNWSDLLEGGTARPTAVPAAITTRLIADVSLASIGWHLRAIRVEGSSQDSLRFTDGWPDGMKRVAGIEPA